MQSTMSTGTSNVVVLPIRSKKLPSVLLEFPIQKLLLKKYQENIIIDVSTKYVIEIIKYNIHKI